MSDEATPPRPDPGWVRQHEVTWEVSVLQETVKDHGVQQTGYTLTLFGRFDAAAQEDDDAVALEVYEGLRALALEALRALPTPPIIEVQPFGPEVLPPGPRRMVDVELAVLVSPPHPEPARPPAETRRDIGTVEGRLRAMGLQPRKS